MLDLNGASNDAGTVEELCGAYQTLPQWRRPSQQRSLPSSPG